MSSKIFPPGIPGISYTSYIYHFGVYFVFGFFLLIAITKGRLNQKYLFFIAILIGIGYGISDEITTTIVDSLSSSFLGHVTFFISLKISTKKFIILFLMLSVFSILFCCIARQEGLEPPTCGFGDRCSTN